jgi:peptide/nickel transport system substrate-binding protein
VTSRAKVAFAGLLWLSALGVLVVAGCASPTPTPPPSVAPTAPPTGGTLRVAEDLAGYDAVSAVTDANGATIGSSAWDPAITYDISAWEVLRCCLLRTLMSYNGHSISQGGAVLHPDLAADMPAVSSDALTWTFHLREGIYYAPPLATTEIVASDFVRAIERATRLQSVAGAYTAPIVGASDYGQASASSISGLETPDKYTLVIHLSQPVADLGARLALPAFAPLPSGVSDGHDTGYGLYLVASGPYMIEGSDQLNPSLPAAQQTPVSGYVAGDHLDLVRNPSWDRSTDPLRSAYVDRIEIGNYSDPDVLLPAIQNDQVDLSIEADLSPADVSTLRGDPATASRVHVITGLQSRYINLNIAVPPFDDVHVRKAVELATNKQALVSLISPGEIVQGHAIPDAFQDGLLAGYAPFATAGNAGDLAAAQAEMAQSVYDTNHDGMCDAAACQNIAVPVRSDRPNVTSAFQAFVTQTAPIGLVISPAARENGKSFYDSLVPAAHAPMAFNVGWETDYLSANGWFGALATSADISDPNGNNFSLIGATPAQLAQFGYSVTSVPSLDSSIAACNQLSGADAFGCWAGVDQYVMQRVVAWVPLSTNQPSRLVSKSVKSFDFDASLAAPALDQIQVNN